MVLLSENSLLLIEVEIIVNVEIISSLKVIFRRRGVVHILQTLVQSFVLILQVPIRSNFGLFLVARVLIFVFVLMPESHLVH